MLAILKLIRFSNAPTIVSDILAGALLAGATFADTLSVSFLLLGSFCLYSWGMALNDLYDVEADRKNDNPRPIVTGSLTASFVRNLCYVLLGLGMLSCLFAGIFTANGQFTPGPIIICLALSLSIWMYDGPLKKSAIAPVVMGCCRGLNLILGGSFVLGSSDSAPDFQELLNLPIDVWIFALAISIYIAGVTWYARLEHQVGSKSEINDQQLRPMLTLGLVGITTAIVLWVGTPFSSFQFPDSRLNVSIWWIGLIWILAVGLMSYPVLSKAIAGLRDPTSRNIKLTIITGLGSIIYWDSLIAFYANPKCWPVALVCLSMIVPVKILRKTIPPT